MKKGGRERLKRKKARQEQTSRSERDHGAERALAHCAEGPKRMQSEKKDGGKFVEKKETITLLPDESVGCKGGTSWMDKDTLCILEKMSRIQRLRGCYKINDLTTSMQAAKTLLRNSPAPKR